MYGATVKRTKMQVWICVNHSVSLETKRSQEKNQVMDKIEMKFDFPVLIQNRYSAKIHQNKLLLCAKTAVITSLITMLSCYDFAHQHLK